MAEKKKPRKKMGRPRIPMITEDLHDIEDKLPPKPIDFKQVLYWMDLGATQEEIAGAFYISSDTLSRRIVEHTGLTFAELRERVSGRAKIELRKNQFKMSRTNSSMAIWLGKQWLGQKDQPIEVQTFDGKLADLLKKLGNVETEDEFNEEEFFEELKKHVDDTAAEQQAD